MFVIKCTTYTYICVSCKWTVHKMWKIQVCEIIETCIVIFCILNLCCWYLTAVFVKVTNALCTQPRSVDAHFNILQTKNVCTFIVSIKDSGLCTFLLIYIDQSKERQDVWDEVFSISLLVVIYLQLIVLMQLYFESSYYFRIRLLNVFIFQWL